LAGGFEAGRVVGAAVFGADDAEVFADGIGVAGAGFDEGGRSGSQ